MLRLHNASIQSSFAHMQHSPQEVFVVFTIFFFSLYFHLQEKDAAYWISFAQNHMESECFKKSEPTLQHSSRMDRPDSPILLNIVNIQTNSGSNGQCNNKIMSEQHKNRICRDFVRGSCRRLYCKYPHVQSNDLVVFCHDYQNSKCPRINCKYVFIAFLLCWKLNWNWLFHVSDFFIIQSKKRITIENMVNFPQKPMTITEEP